jgi:hypothetical protein
MANNSIGIKFTDLTKLKLILPYLIVDKGSIESLSANDCILISQPFPKQTEFTIVDPSRATIKLRFNHNALDDSGGINTNNEQHEEFYWSTLLHFPDFLEKTTRIFKSNVISSFLTTVKGNYTFKNTSITGSTSSLSLKSYPGSTTDFRGPEEVTLPLVRINALELLNNLKIVNQFSESSREKRGVSVTASKQLLFNIDFTENKVYVLAPSKNQLSCINSFANCTSYPLNKELMNLFSSFCVEARFIKQLVYISNGAYVDIFVSPETNNQWVTFKSDIGEITLLRSRVSVNYKDNNLLFTSEDKIVYGGLSFDYNVLYNRAFNTNDLLNAAGLLQPAKTELFINRLILLENNNEITVLPSNDISAKDVVSFKYLFQKDNEFVPFLVLGNLLIHSLKTMLSISRHYKQADSKMLITVKELLTPRGSTLNLFIKCIIIETGDPDPVVRLDDNFNIWVSIDKVTQNMDLLNVED